MNTSIKYILYTFLVILSYEGLLLSRAHAMQNNDIYIRYEQQVNDLEKEIADLIEERRKVLLRHSVGSLSSLVRLNAKIDANRKSIAGLQSEIDKFKYVFLNQVIQKLEVTRPDPPFFMLETPKGRKVYILGSIHNRHPGVLLSSHNYAFIEQLSENAILFVEGKEEDQACLEMNRASDPQVDDPMSSNGKPDRSILQDQWKVSLWDSKLARTWLEIKKYTFEDRSLKLSDITKFEKSVGLILFYLDILAKTINQNLGFEHSIQKLSWSQVLELDDNEFCKQIMSNNPSIARKYFELALRIAPDIIQYKKSITDLDLWLNELVKIAYNYKYDINNYDIRKYILPKGNDLEVVKRNRMWAKRVHKYLDDNAEDMRPILIVCGGDHLEGAGVANSKSLVAFLMRTSHFSTIHTINTDNEEVDFFMRRELPSQIQINQHRSK
jgi:hypothetical protein